MIRMEDSEGSKTSHFHLGEADISPLKKIRLIVIKTMEANKYFSIRLWKHTNICYLFTLNSLHTIDMEAGFLLGFLFALDYEMVM